MFADKISCLKYQLQYQLPRFVLIVLFYIIAIPMVLILSIRDVFNFSSDHDLQYFPREQANEQILQKIEKDPSSVTPDQIRAVFDQPTMSEEAILPTFLIHRLLKSLYSNIFKGLSLSEFNDNYMYEYPISHITKILGNLIRRLSLLSNHQQVNNQLEEGEYTFLSITKLIKQETNMNN